MSVDPPYGVILDSLLSGYVVPVLGAGASLIGRPPVEWDDTSNFPPTGGELSRFLAASCAYPSAERRKLEELAKVSSYYQDIGSRRLLRQRLRKVFVREYKPNCLHELLLNIERKQRLVVVVTNYDTLLEDALLAARLKAETEELRKRPFDVVVYPADDKSNRNSMLRWHWNGELLEKQKPEHPNNLWIDETTTVIFKMHGSVWKDSDLWDNFVITEEDYLDFMSRMINQTAVPKIIADYFRNKSFLFLGYSLQDWNMRVILRHLGRSHAAGRRSRDSGAPDSDESLMPSWAIQLKVEDDDEKLWKTRNVNLYEVDLQVFAETMHNRMDR